MWTNPQFHADLFAFTKETLHGELPFFAVNFDILIDLTWLHFKDKPRLRVCCSICG